MSRWSYLGAAFNARPFGMAIPPNWLALAAFGMLGSLLNPGFFLIGAGLEIAYLWSLTGSARFRTAVDAAARAPGSGWDGRWQAMMARLGPAERELQAQLEERCSKIDVHQRELGAGGGEQSGRLARLCWLHLRLLSARHSLAQAERSGAADGAALAAQRAQLEERLAGAALDARLRESLDDQLQVIRDRQQAHAEAARRLEFVDAELERIRQQVALTHEQALLATDADSIAISVDALSASLGEANRWLQEQHEILGGLDDLDEPPADLFARRGRRERGAAREHE